jgi:hypothetical protein
MVKRSVMGLALVGLFACSGERGRSVDASPPTVDAAPPPPVDAAPPPPDQGPVITATTPTLALAATPAPAGQLAARLDYVRRPAQTGARLAELRLAVGAGLEFSHALAGPAATRAGKTVTTRVKADGTLRVIVMSPASVTHLKSGPLATLYFKPRAEGPRDLTLKTERPWFAPVQANQGIVLPPTLSVGW